MSRVCRVGLVAAPLLLAVALGGCTAGAPTTTSTPQSSGRAVTGVTGVTGVTAAAAEAGADVGNGRPHVTNDGLMVRRRVVVAIRRTPGADLVSLRREMDRAAARSHLVLSTLPAGVLDPALLEHLAPDLVLALPAGKTLSDARRMVSPAFSKARQIPGVAALQVAPVLVHDLRFTVSSAEPAALAAGIDAEGILSDALGSYTATPGRGRLDIAYTGPLLSDDLVELVRRGIARRADIQPAAVSLSARSTRGTGVDMASEPAPASVPTEEPKVHHDHGAALPAVRPASLSSSPAASSRSSSSASTLRSVSVTALPSLLVLTLVLLLLRRRLTLSGPDRLAEGDAEKS